MRSFPATIFSGDFCCEQNFNYEFGIDGVYQKGFKLIYAHHDNDDGNAYVLLAGLTGLRPYFIEASHCSCYGLEECWDPTPINRAALVAKDFWGNAEVKEALLEAYDKAWPNEGDDESLPYSRYRDIAVDINFRRELAKKKAAKELEALREEFPELFVPPAVAFSNSIVPHQWQFVPFN